MPPNLTTVMNELDTLRKEIEDGAPQYWHETDAKSGAGEYLDLPERPTVEQLRSALERTRYDIVQVIEKVLDALETNDDNAEEIARLKNHRHDTTKAYSGRPEM